MTLRHHTAARWALLFVAASTATMLWAGTDVDVRESAGTASWLALDDAVPIDCPAEVAGVQTTARSSCVTTGLGFGAVRKQIKRLLKGDQTARHASEGWRYLDAGARRRLLVGRAFFDVVHSDSGTVAVIPASCMELADDVRDLHELESLPKIIGQARPEYPEAARINPTEGFAVVQLVIDERGKLRDACIAAERPEGVDFGRATLESLRGARFVPGGIEGLPVPSLFTVSVDFDFGGTR